jgi:uncharacterized protein
MSMTPALRSILLPLLLAPLLVVGHASGVGAQDTTLQARGSGEVEVAPDRARISFAVETEATTAQEAGQENARLMDQVMAAVRQAGPSEMRVETLGYQLEPRYRFVGDERRREIAGYTARNTLQVIVDEVELVGPLVDAALGAGANRVANLAFEIRDPEPHRLEALRQAVEQARGEAQTMAEALGMRLGSPSRVEGGAERPTPQPTGLHFRMEAMAADAPTTPVEAGLQRITASVTITYRLHPE